MAAFGGESAHSWDECYIKEYWEQARQIVGGNMDVSVAASYSKRGMQVLIVVPEACFQTQRGTAQAALEDLRKEFQSYAVVGSFGSLRSCSLTAKQQDSNDG